MPVPLSAVSAGFLVQGGVIQPILGLPSPLHPLRKIATNADVTIKLGTLRENQVGLVEPKFIAHSPGWSRIGQTPQYEEGGLYQTSIPPANRSLVSRLDFVPRKPPAPHFRQAWGAV